MKKLPFCTFVLFASLSALVTAHADENWISLFDGETLDGWKINESPDSWRVEDGAIVANGPRSHLFYEGSENGSEFQNFEFEAEVLTTRGSNSGIYVHTRFQEEGWPAEGYECQIFSSKKPNSVPGKYIERKMTGSIYAIRNTWVSPIGDDVWFTYRIRVVGNTIQTFVNGELVCEYSEARQLWRPEDKKGRQLGSGTFALQAHDPGSVVRFRNLRVKRLLESLPTPGSAETDSEIDRLVTGLSNSNYALIDIGVSSGSNGYSSSQMESARRFGLTLLSVDLKNTPDSLLIVNDRDSAPDVNAMRSAATRGVKIVFSSGGDSELNASRIKRRLASMQSAELSWDDLWVPGE